MKERKPPSNVWVCKACKRVAELQEWQRAAAEAAQYQEEWDRAAAAAPAE
jgi:hypothetical protein